MNKVETIKHQMEEQDFIDLIMAHKYLEHPNFTARIADLIGTPVDTVLKLIPKKFQGKINEATHKAIREALKFSVKTLKKGKRNTPSKSLHKLMVGISGGAGGAFGLAALTVELPVSTAIIMRSIADIARSEGEDITGVGAQLACIEVFALGGKSPHDDSSETGYFATRAAMAKSITDASKYIASKGMADKGAPVIMRFISQIASRFGIVVSEKVAAQSVPIIGGIGGATINLLFIDHFQNIATGHFIVRRLERKYDAKIIEDLYRQLD